MRTIVYVGERVQIDAQFSVEGKKDINLSTSQNIEMRQADREALVFQRCGLHVPYLAPKWL